MSFLVLSSGTSEPFFRNLWERGGQEGTRKGRSVRVSEERRIPIGRGWIVGVSVASDERTTGRGLVTPFLGACREVMVSALALTFYSTFFCFFSQDSHPFIGFFGEEILGLLFL